MEPPEPQTYPAFGHAAKARLSLGPKFGPEPGSGHCRPCGKAGFRATGTLAARNWVPQGPCRNQVTNLAPTGNQPGTNVGWGGQCDGIVCGTTTTRWQQKTWQVFGRSCFSKQRVSGPSWKCNFKLQPGHGNPSFGETVSTERMPRFVLPPSGPPPPLFDNIGGTAAFYVNGEWVSRPPISAR